VRRTEQREGKREKNRGDFMGGKDTLLGRSLNAGPETTSIQGKMRR